MSHEKNSCRPKRPIITIVFQGEYCVDYHIYYADGGDEIDYIEGGVANAADCRRRCEANSRCRFYSYSQGVNNNNHKSGLRLASKTVCFQSCSLLANDDFVPEYDDTATSGSVQGECRDMGEDYSGVSLISLNF